MNLDTQASASPRRLIGIATVALLHLLIGYALVSGLGRHVVDVIKKPLDTKLIVELPPLPPPPPPPPPKEIVKPQATPKAEATPPPAYVPPPEIAAPATEAAPLQAVAETAPAKTAPAEIAPPPELPAAPPKPEKLTVDGSCPGYANTLRQAFAGLYDKYEIAGTVTVRVQVRGNAITKVNVLSGPREYQRAVVAAVSSLSCQVSGGTEGYFELPIVFREE